MYRIGANKQSGTWEVEAEGPEVQGLLCLSYIYGNFQANLSNMRKSIKTKERQERRGERGLRI